MRQNDRESMVAPASEEGAPDTRGRLARTMFVLIAGFGALYLGRIVFEPVAFVLFIMALVDPFQRAAEARFGKATGLLLAVLITLLTVSALVGGVVWSVGNITHWSQSNLNRFSSLFEGITTWLDGHDIHVLDLYEFDSSALLGLFRVVAGLVNTFLAFAIVVLLCLLFGLAEMDRFRDKVAVLDTRLSGWSLSETSGRIAARVRTYMLIRTLAGLATGLGVFLFAMFIGLDLAVSWGIMAFVLNFIPYIGTLVATVLPVIFAAAQFGSLEAAALIFAGLYLIQFIIGSYLEPMLAGNALAISPFVMLIAFLVWDFLWGMPGAFIGLPVTIAIYTILEQNPRTSWIADMMSTRSAAPGAVPVGEIG
jgi:predicted PurR-regulated permease PerM